MTMNTGEKIEVGVLLRISTDKFLTSGSSNKFKRQVVLKKDEIIEIRYPYAWHFRTEDNHYFHATPEMIIENCRYFGSILEQVRFWNKSSLEEILRLHLYEE